MIENVLVVGARVRWTKPITVAAPQDGSITASVNASSPMLYLGSTQPQARGGLFSRSSPGYQLPAGTAVPHTWLDYIPGRTAFVRQGTDVLTGFMSGCLIARGTRNGVMSVFHMGTVESRITTNVVKAGFRTELPVDTTGFYPAAAWTVNERAATGRATDIIALVTSAGSCFSIMLCHGTNEYVVGGIKKVEPLNRVRIMARLM